METLLTGKMISVDDEMYEFFRTKELAIQAQEQRGRLYPNQHWQLCHTITDGFQGWHLERYESLEPQTSYTLTAEEFFGED
jgi:hypothetical protein